MSVTTRAIGAPLDLADGPDKVKGAAKERQSHSSVWERRLGARPAVAPRSDILSRLVRKPEHADVVPGGSADRSLGLTSGGRRTARMRR
jgi:hypothetical protein